MKPHEPSFLPLELDWGNLVSDIARANAELARYDGMLRGMPNPVLLLTPLSTQEAVLSSRIEGTQATAGDVLEYEALKTIGKEKYDDVQEIQNYRRAMAHAMNYMASHPISLNLIRQIHGILLDSVRGKDKSRGEFRKIQNWIGKPGAKIEEATYIPPAPENLGKLLDNMEKYIHHEEVDRLTQLAIIHAQFEIIHPFIDGNGRVGRILIPLFLMEKGLLSIPTFYISAYFERNRQEYYQRLSDITENSSWNEWIVFFLNAVSEQAKENMEMANAIMNLYAQTKQIMTQQVRSRFSIQALDAMFERPIFSTGTFIEESGIPRPSAIKILDKLRKAEIITVLQETTGRRPSIMAFNPLLSIIKLEQ